MQEALTRYSMGWKKCNHCDGRGKIRCHACGGTGNYFYGKPGCGGCNGTGEMTCPICMGTRGQYTTEANKEAGCAILIAFPIIGLIALSGVWMWLA
jgi:DnaJ-class molecular chaperone